MLGCDLDLWPLDLELLQHFGCHAFKLCTKFERNRIIHGWSSYRRFSAFSRAILGGGSELTELSQGCVDPTSPTWLGHSAIISQHCTFFRFRMCCCIFKCGRLKVAWCFKLRQISHFWPPVKIRGVVARSLYQLLKLNLRPNLRNTFDGRHLRGCWARWIDKKEINKWIERLWVKLKAFPTNSGRPKNLDL